MENYLSRRRKRKIDEASISDSIDSSFRITDKKVIDEYQKAIEFVIKYNFAYERKLSKFRFDEIWNLRYEISFLQEKLKKYNKEKNSRMVGIFKAKIKIRAKYIKENLLMKYKKS